MGYILVLILVWFSALLVKGKKGYILTAISFAWMAYLGGTASPIGTFDYLAYQSIYNRTAMGIDTRTEWLYTYLSKLAINSGLYYSQFRIILVACIFVVLYIAIIRLTDNPVLFASFFMVVPFFQEITQIRSFAAYTIILLGISFLDTLSFRKLVVYYALNTLAMGFHTSAGIFLILPVIQYVVGKVGVYKSLRWSVWISILLALFLLLLTRGSFIVNIIAKTIEVIAGSTVATTFLSLMAVSGGSKSYFLIIYISYLIIAFLSLRKSDNTLDMMRYPGLYAGFLIAFISSPILLISTQFNRIQRFGFELVILIVTIMVVKWSRDRVPDSKLRFIMICIVTTVLACTFYGVFTLGDDFRTSIPYLMHLVN